MNPDGTSKVQISTGVVAAQGPYFSPDSSRVAFVDGTGNGTLFICLFVLLSQFSQKKVFILQQVGLQQHKLECH